MFSSVLMNSGIVSMPFAIYMTWPLAVLYRLTLATSAIRGAALVTLRTSYTIKGGNAILKSIKMQDCQE